MWLQWAFPFNIPVDTIRYTDYLRVVEQPMDLGTIKRQLDSGCYHTPQPFARDMRLVFDNAKKYNPPGTDVHVMASILQVRRCRQLSGPSCFHWILLRTLLDTVCGLHVSGLKQLRCGCLKLSDFMVNYFSARSPFACWTTRTMLPQEKFEERWAATVAQKVADEPNVCRAAEAAALRAARDAAAIAASESLSTESNQLVGYLDTLEARIADAKSIAAAACKPLSPDAKVRHDEQLLNA